MNNPDSQIKATIFNGYITRDDIMLDVVRQMCCGIPPGVGPVARLEYGLNMSNPIRDFRTDETGIHAVLSFAQTPTETFVPWEAVTGLHCPMLRFAAFWIVTLPKDSEIVSSEPVASAALPNCKPKKPVFGLVP